MNRRVPYSLLALCLLLLGLCVAFLIPQRGFFRGFAGDVLVVMFLYACLKALFPRLNPLPAAAGVLGFALSVEFLQYLGLPRCFDKRSYWLILTLGSTFDPMDIAAYALGAVLAGAVDGFLLTR